jgi:hypothetical protein
MWYQTYNPNKTRCPQYISRHKWPCHYGTKSSEDDSQQHSQDRWRDKNTIGAIVNHLTFALGGGRFGVFLSESEMLVQLPNISTSKYYSLPMCVLVYAVASYCIDVNDSLFEDLTFCLHVLT